MATASGAQRGTLVSSLSVDPGPRAHQFISYLLHSYYLVSKNSSLLFIYHLLEDPKNAHLLALDGAKERLALCGADVLDCEASVSTC